MSQATDRATTKYVDALLAFLDRPRPVPEPPPSPPGPGRQKVLGKIRHKGHFLRAIAKISLANKTLGAYSEIARELHKRPAYRHVSPRQLRRDVAETLNWVTGLFLGREPSAGVLNRELRQKVLKILRYQLMARKR